MAPPVPNPTIAWETLGLSVSDFVHGHIESTFTVATSAWSSPIFVASPELQIHGLSPALNYGMQCYEGLKAVRTTDDRITIFRPQFHARRMMHSAEVVSMPPVPEDVFMDCITQAVQLNAEFVGPSTSNAVLYIRPLLFGAGAQLALEPPSSFKFVVFVQPATTYHGVQPLPCLVMEDHDRAATRGTGHAKIGGNYAPTIKYQKAAKEAGFYMTLHLDSATMTEIDEFSTSGFIGIKNARQEGEMPTVVVPDSRNVIDSVTSDSLFQLAKLAGYTVEKRRIPYAELPDFNEVLAVGTAASVLPIAAIVRNSTGDKFVYCPTGKPGPVGVQLAELIKGVMKGEKEDDFGWVYEVPFPEEERVMQRFQVMDNAHMSGRLFAPVEWLFAEVVPKLISLLGRKSGYHGKVYS